MTGRFVKWRTLDVQIVIKKNTNLLV